jgi:hypothetical protein
MQKKRVDTAVIEGPGHSEPVPSSWSNGPRRKILRAYYACPQYLRRDKNHELQESLPLFFTLYGGSGFSAPRGS